MSASAVAAPADTSSMSMESELGDVLQSAADSVLAPEQATEAVAEPAVEEPVAEPIAEPAAEAVAAPPAAEAPADGITYKLTPDGASYLVPKADLPMLTGMKQYAEAVQNHFPTANDAKLGYLESSDFRAMRADYLGGDPANIDAMLGYWAGKDHTDPALAGQMRQSFTKMAERLPEVLKTIDPQAHAKMGDAIVQSRIDAAYAQAAESQNPEDLLAAQRLDWGHTGRYKTELPKVDPQAAQRTAQEQRQKAIDDREAGLLSRDWTSFNKTTLEGPKWQAFNAEIDKTLAPIKSAYEPVVFDALRERIGKQVVAKLQEDFDWARNHGNELNMLQSQYRQLWKEQKPADGLKPRIQTYTNDFMARVRRHLPSIAQPLLSKAAAKPAAAATVKPKPQTSPQTPPRAADGKFQTQKGAQPYDLLDDPEFTSAFQVH